MSTNYHISVDLLKMKGAKVSNIQGSTGTKKCLVLPIDDNDGLFLGKKGLYLNLNAYELKEPRFEQTHLVKPDIPKLKRDSMNEEERAAIPILGNMKPIEYGQTAMAVTETVPQAAFESDDLPF